MLQSLREQLNLGLIQRLNQQIKLLQETDAQSMRKNLFGFVYLINKSKFKCNKKSTLIYFHIRVDFLLLLIIIHLN